LGVCDDELLDLADLDPRSTFGYWPSVARNRNSKGWGFLDSRIRERATQ